MEDRDQPDKPDKSTSALPEIKYFIPVATSRQSIRVRLVDSFLNFLPFNKKSAPGLRSLRKMVFRSSSGWSYFLISRSRKKSAPVLARGFCICLFKGSNRSFGNIRSESMGFISL